MKKIVSHLLIALTLFSSLIFGTQTQAVDVVLTPAEQAVLSTLSKRLYRNTLDYSTEAAKHRYLYQPLTYRTFLVALYQRSGALDCETLSSLFTPFQASCISKKFNITYSVDLYYKTVSRALYEQFFSYDQNTTNTGPVRISDMILGKFKTGTGDKDTSEGDTTPLPVPAGPPAGTETTPVPAAVLRIKVDGTARQSSKYKIMTELSTHALHVSAGTAKINRISLLVRRQTGRVIDENMSWYTGPKLQILDASGVILKESILERSRTRSPIDFDFGGLTLAEGTYTLKLSMGLNNYRVPLVFSVDATGLIVTDSNGKAVPDKDIDLSGSAVSVDVVE